MVQLSLTYAHPVFDGREGEEIEEALGKALEREWEWQGKETIMDRVYKALSSFPEFKELERKLGYPEWKGDYRLTVIPERPEHTFWFETEGEKVVVVSFYYYV